MTLNLAKNRCNTLFQPIYEDKVPLLIHVSLEIIIKLVQEYRVTTSSIETLCFYIKSKKVKKHLSLLTKLLDVTLN